MIRRFTFRTMILVLALTMSAALAQAAKLSPTLQTTLASVANNVSVGVVIVSFNTNNGLNDTHLSILRNVGITKGIRLNRLGMVAMPATAGQVRALAGNSAVRSIWSNDRLYYFMNQARMLAGVDRLLQDSQFTLANGGLPVSGAGNFSVVINDSGIDATRSDLQYGTRVVQNVQMLTDTETLTGFTSLVGIENQPNTDSHVGHGTHCAGVIAAARNGWGVVGVAPEASLYAVKVMDKDATGRFSWGPRPFACARPRIAGPKSWPMS